MNDQLLDSEQVPAFLQDLENFLQLRLGIKWDFSWDEDNECLFINLNNPLDIGEGHGE